VRFFRTVLGLIGAVVTLGPGAASAQAPPVPITLPARAVTVKAAVLRGTVATAGLATLYQFQYGRSTSYGSTTSAHVIPSGQGTVSASAKVTDLLAARRYHFRLVAQSGPGTQYYPLVINFAGDRSFVTLAGSMALTGRNVTVLNRIASAELTCVSSLACKGVARLTLATGHGTNRHLITLAKKSFSVRAHRHATIELALSGKAISLLTAARGHRLDASFGATTRTRQSPLSRHVTLILG